MTWWLPSYGILRHAASRVRDLRKVVISAVGKRSRPADGVGHLDDPVAPVVRQSKVAADRVGDLGEVSSAVGEYDGVAILVDDIREDALGGKQVASLVFLGEDQAVVGVLNQGVKNAGLRDVNAAGQGIGFTMPVAPFDDHPSGCLDGEDVVAVGPVGTQGARSRYRASCNCAGRPGGIPRPGIVKSACW